MMPGPKHAPKPWSERDHKEKGIAIVDGRGEPVCFLHYPKSVKDFGNKKVILKSPELLESLKNVTMVLEAMIRHAKQDPSKDAFLRGARQLIDECDFKNPVKGKQDETL